VNELLDEESLASLRYSVNKGKPYGTMDWTAEMVDQFGLAHTVRSAGRPMNN
jgi:hypothetical protein